MQVTPKSAPSQASRRGWMLYPAASNVGSGLPTWPAATTIASDLSLPLLWNSLNRREHHNSKRWRVDREHERFGSGERAEPHGFNPKCACESQFTSRTYPQKTRPAGACRSHCNQQRACGCWRGYTSWGHTISILVGPAALRRDYVPQMRFADASTDRSEARRWRGRVWRSDRRSGSIRRRRDSGAIVLRSWRP
jgi:hypothetical protein